MDCRFCNIYQKGDEVFYQNKLFFAVYDRFPISPGHAEVIPKRHIDSLFDLVGTEESRLLLPALREVKEIIEQKNLWRLYQSFIDHPLNEKSVEFCKKMLNHTGITKTIDGYNVGINDGEAAGRTIPHLHVHLIPRFHGDVEDPIGGVRHIIPGMGNYKK